jgi:hypothetical protein
MKIVFEVDDGNPNIGEFLDDVRRTGMLSSAFDGGVSIAAKLVMSPNGQVALPD